MYSFLLILVHVFFVSFTDKPEKSAPALSPRAMEQRAKWGIETDELDYPVSRLYVDSLRSMGVQVHHTSRWFNGATVAMDSTTAAKVNRLGFVCSVAMTRDDSEPGTFYAKRRMPVQMPDAASSTDAWTAAQLSLYNLQELHQAGFEGQGILMTICDGGFYNADKMACFRQATLELGHFDFTDDAVGFYGHTGAHGTQCLSAISGLTEGFRGAATQAQYYLMRTEENDTESPKEMDNLVAALEKSDSLGVNVFSVSLGYAMFDNAGWTLPYSALDGRSTRVSLAATIAARKGMLVCVAAGNEGEDIWRSISVPADADSILTVGAVTTDSIIAGFSSYGPSADGRIKPEVCAVGVHTTLINPWGSIITSNGTSFATPLLAGMAACLWSALPDEDAMHIRERIIRSCDHYADPDNAQSGYGIPNAWKAYTMSGESGVCTVQEAILSTKELRNGQIVIVRQGRVYDMTGRLLR